MSISIEVSSSDWVDLRTRGFAGTMYLLNTVGAPLEYSIAASPASGTFLTGASAALISGTYLWVRGAGAAELFTPAEWAEYNTKTYPVSASHSDVGGVRVFAGDQDITDQIGGGGGGSPTMVFAKNFAGVDITGATDSTTAINTAIAALPAGTVVYFHPGIYTASIRVTVPNITLTGTWAATIKAPSGATSHINDACVRLLADDCVVENLTLNGNKANNSAIDDFSLGRWADGVAIYANRCSVRNNRIKDTIGHKVIVWNESFDPTGTPKGARQFFSIEGNHITGVGQRASIDVASTDVTAGVSNNGIIRGNLIDDMVLIVHTGDDLLIEGNVIRCPGLTSGGIQVHTGSNRVSVINNVIGPCSVGINSQNYCFDLVVRGNKVSSTSGAGILIQNCTRAFVDGNFVHTTGAGAEGIGFSNVVGGSIRNNHVHLAGGTSVSVGAGSSDIMVSGNRSSSPSAYGVAAATVSGLTVRGNALIGGQIGVAATSGVNTGLIIEGNDIKSTSANGIYTTGNGPLIRNNSVRSAGAHAIRIQGQGSRVTGNDLRDITGIGIYLTVAVTGVAITDNNIVNSSGAAIAGMQPDTIVRRNTGYVTEARGSATIADAASSVVVTHGLAAAPTSAVVTSRGSEAVWVSARTATTFTVSRAGTAGALAFDWQAEI